MSDQAIDLWTGRLREAAPTLDEPTARRFVRELYEAARQDLGVEESEAEFERDE